MTPAEILAARKSLGLTQSQMAEALRLGKDGRRIVRGWEKGERKPSGPTTLAIEYLLKQQTRKASQRHREGAADR